METERYRELVELLQAEARLRMWAAIRPDCRAGLIRCAEAYSGRVRALWDEMKARCAH